MRRRVARPRSRFPFHLYHFAFIVCFLAFLFSLTICADFGNAQEKAKPRILEWQINGILAALDDGYPTVKQEAFQKLVAFDAENLKAFPKQSEEIGERAIKVLKSEVAKNSKEDSDLRISAVRALGNVGKTNIEAVQILTEILRNNKEDDPLRLTTVEALRDMGKLNTEAVQILLRIVKNNKEDRILRSTAAEALGNAAEINIATVQILTSILKNDEYYDLIKPFQALGKVDRTNSAAVQIVLSDVLKNTKENLRPRIVAAEALRSVGKLNTETVQTLTDIVKNNKEDRTLRITAAEALGNVDKLNTETVQILTSILKNSKEDSHLRIMAVELLGNAGKLNTEAIQILTGILKNGGEDDYDRSSIRSNALQVLGNVGKTNSAAVQVLISLVKNDEEDLDLHIDAVEALGNASRTNSAAVQALTDIVKNTKEYLGPRFRAAQILINMGKANNAAVQVLADIIKNTKEDFDRRTEDPRIVAVKALGNAAKLNNDAAIQVLASILNSEEDLSLRTTAAEALGNVGKTNSMAVQILTHVLNNIKENEDFRIIAAEALGNIKKLELGEVLALVEMSSDRTSCCFYRLRFASYFYGRGDSEITTLLKWIGSPKRDSIPTQLSQNAARKTLEIFAKVWKPSQEFRESRAELAGAIAEVAKMVHWQTGDIPLLEQHYKNLRDAKSKSADSVKAALDSLILWKYFNQARNIIAIHLFFWIALIFAYPRSPIIQALFFWNPWIRKFAGLGYVSILLVSIPFLRHKLFEPFQAFLRADAGLGEFDSHTYFDQSEVKVRNKEERQPIRTAIPQAKGQIILLAESGLGKTMYLRYLMQQSKRITVYLTAQECANTKDQDVIQAIQAKLPIVANDADFLRSLIYSGAIDIYIDGLNEVSSETRYSISKFTRHYFQGNIILTTQPLSHWTPPPTAKTYILQPLRPDQIEEFLHSRQSSLPDNAKLRGKDYDVAYKTFLAKVLEPNQPPEDLDTAQRILSNPMDLETIAEMIAAGETPELFNLQQQRYDRMAEDYRAQHFGNEFPLKPFSEMVYQMRLNDQDTLPKDQFVEAILCLEKHKMVLSQRSIDGDDKPTKAFYFRHDKIREFFIVQTFLGSYAKMRSKYKQHMDDSRFRGVYFQLATLLPLDDAQRLREDLIEYGTSTGDHTVMDNFVQLLRSRPTNLS